jgi:dTDP-4-dehydrorhamnose reductase
MLGHKLYQTLDYPFDAWVTVRDAATSLAKYGFFCPDRVIGAVDGLRPDTISAAFEQVKPDAVINCIGIVKQRPEASDTALCDPINARLPHRLASMFREYWARLIHISTDCVFSGKKGGAYTEDDVADAQDLYGRTKAQGETHASNALTLRTSIIGRELGDGFGLVEWFLKQKGAVRGFTHARFSGLTTHELSRVLQRVLVNHRKMSGIFQVSSEPIDKASLLTLLRTEFRTKATIAPCDEVRIDRTLDSSRFRRETGYVPPSWPEMVREVAADPTPYGSWRSS